MTSQNGAMLRIRGALYVISTLAALASVATSTLREQQQEDHILVVMAMPFFLWTVLFGTFIWLSFLEMAKDSKVVITCVYHLICVGATMAFLSSILPNSGNTFFLWTPIGTQVGILLAIGLRECILMISWRRIRRLVLSFLEGLQELMGVEGPRLPTYEHDLLGYTPPSRPSWTYTSHAPEWHIMQTLSATAPAALTAYEHNRSSPNDMFEDNPWERR
ncbi:hypothetical protein BJ166DRAFT_325461 [Pestalotiopsis sp. NC0098]|nr:hypothetical protein BJ166DRAFT_325461 [Pestalotiopsis sp. NC0098]